MGASRRSLMATASYRDHDATHGVPLPGYPLGGWEGDGGRLFCGRLLALTFQIGKACHRLVNR